MNSLDIFIQNYVSLIRTAPLTQYVYLLTILFDLSLHFILISLCVGFLIYIVRNLYYSILFFFSLMCGAIAVYVLKYLFSVSRPTDALILLSNQSFPSGHATIAAIFFIMLMYIFDDYFKSFGRIIFNSICTFGIFSIAFSRVYLGVHWASDVLAGVVLGAVVSYVLVILFNHMRFTKKIGFVVK